MAADAAGDAPTHTLSEVVVEARKTSENVQNVPLTVNVLAGKALEDKGVEQLSNLSALAPNLVWSDAGGGTFTNKVTMRGIYSNATSQGFDPGVAIYVDDVYVANQFGFNSALLDIDRIEILKGPQGTLFGRNAAAGAISVHTTAPDTTHFFATADERVGNYALFEERLLVNIPLSDIAALKFSGIARDRDGYQKNSLTGKQDLNDEHFAGGRLQLLVKPTDNFDILGTAEYYRNHDHQDVYSCSAAPGFSCPNATRGDVFNNVAADNNSTTSRTIAAGSIKANWHVSHGIDLTSITALSGLKVHQDQDQDYTPIDYIRSGYSVPHDREFSQELRLTTDQKARLRGIAGLYYFSEDRTTIIPEVFTPAFVAAVGGSAPSNAILLTNSRLKTSSYAVFGQGQFDILPDLTAELGLRYTDDHKDFAYSSVGNAVEQALPTAIAVNILGLFPLAQNTASASFNKLSYTTSLSWHPAEHLLLYGRYSTGFKAGGFQAATFSPTYNPFKPFGPENSQQVEVGAKTELLDGRVRFNAAAFHTDYANTQVQITDPATLQKVVGNFGSARAEGVEFESTALLTDDLTVDANLGLQHSKFVSGALVGRVFQFVPKATASFSLHYRHDLWSGWEGVGAATVSYRSTINLNTNAPGTANFLASEPLTVLNTRLGAQKIGGGLGIYLWSNNLNDEQRFANFTPGNAGNPPAYHISAPRTYGVELRATF
ncbi:TonB-dependent receptor [Phenylobacterium sp.]|uniref:TonB-dependent receptor n=1 Tax=Phenylobacterium sp. TaxID=1871053 RepID=UPI0035692607